MRTARLLVSVFVGVPLAFGEVVAQAQPETPAGPPVAAPVPPSAPVAAPEPQDEDEHWRDSYRIARDRMLAGDFADAAGRFDGLARTAAQPIDRALAANMRDLAQSWAARGLALVNRSALGESTLSAKSVGERTTDEIAQLYLSSILYGVGTGLWLDAHTQAHDPPALILPVIGFAGMAAGAVALVDIWHRPGYGVPQSVVSGLNIGLEEGIVLSLWAGTQAAGQQWSGQTVADVVWGLSTVGALAGAAIGVETRTTPGRASFVGSAALWTSVVAGLVGVAATSSGGDVGNTALLAAGVGLNVGVVGGLLAAAPLSPTIGRVRFLDIGAIGGGLLFGGVGLALSGTGGNAQVLSGVTALGVATGLGVAWYATSGMPADRPLGQESDSRALVLQPMVTPVAGGATLGLGGRL